MTDLDVAIATCAELPEPDPDQAPLLDALRDAGLRAELLGWDDPAADFGRARLTVLRSTWNYPRAPDAFRAWVEATAERSILLNPIEAVQWNLHKGYLRELERAGVGIVPTELVPEGDRRPLADIARSRSWSQVVVKPAIGAASFRNGRFAAGDADGEAHLRSVVEHGDVLVQRYLEAIESHGERSLIWIDGELTHAIRKSPRFGGESESVSEGSVPIGEAEAELARRAVAVPGIDLLYARVDVVPGPDGAPVVMELELMEPSLYFVQSPAALERFVSSLKARSADTPASA